MDILSDSDKNHEKNKISHCKGIENEWRDSYFYIRECLSEEVTLELRSEQGGEMVM